MTKWGKLGLTLAAIQTYPLFAALVIFLLLISGAEVIIPDIVEDFFAVFYFVVLAGAQVFAPIAIIFGSIYTFLYYKRKVKAYIFLATLNFLALIPMFIYGDWS